MFVLLACLAGCGGDDGSSGGERGTLALDFQPNPVHAGIYAAENIRIRVPSASTDSLKLLAAGRADMSVVDIHDLGLARERGSDIVGVGALVQRPLAARDRERLGGAPPARPRGSPRGRDGAALGRGGPACGGRERRRRASSASAE